VRAHCTPRTRFLVLNSPANPAAEVFDRDRLLGDSDEGANAPDRWAEDAPVLAGPGWRNRQTMET